MAGDTEAARGIGPIPRHLAGLVARRTGMIRERSSRSVVTMLSTQTALACSRKGFKGGALREFEARGLRFERYLEKQNLPSSGLWLLGLWPG